MTNRMILNETSWFGRGAVNELVPEVLRRGYGKALIVTDAQLVSCGIVEKVTSKLDAAELEYQIFDEVMPNPTIAVVQRGLAAF